MADGTDILSLIGSLSLPLPTNHELDEMAQSHPTQPVQSTENSSPVSRANSELQHNLDILLRNMSRDKGSVSARNWYEDSWILPGAVMGSAVDGDITGHATISAALDRATQGDRSRRLVVATLEWAFAFRSGQVVSGMFFAMAPAELEDEGVQNGNKGEETEQESQAL